jgi:hypothetical protein
MAGEVVAGVNAVINLHKSNVARKQADAAQDAMKHLIDKVPTYDIPSEYQSMENLVNPYTKASQVAGQAYMQNEVDNNSAASVAKAQQMGLSPSAITSVLSSANNSSNKAATELGIAGAEQRAGYIGKDIQVSQAMADQKAIKWNLEKNQPYQNWMSFYRDRYLDQTGYNRQQFSAGQANAQASGDKADEQINNSTNAAASVVGGLI